MLCICASVNFVIIIYIIRGHGSRDPIKDKPERSEDSPCVDIDYNMTSSWFDGVTGRYTCNNDNQHQSQAPWENICAQFPDKDSLIFMVGILILNISCSCAVMACVNFCNDQSRRTPMKFPSNFKCDGKNCYQDVDGLVQERCNSSALAMELRLSCTKPSVDGSVNGSVQKRRNSIANALELRLSCTNPLMCACSG